MYYLKKHWRWMLPLLAVTCLLIIGMFYMHLANQPSELVVTYHVPDHTADEPARTNTGTLPEFLPNVPDAVLVKPADIQPPEELILLDEMATQMAEESLKDSSVVESQQDEIGEVKEVPDAAPIETPPLTVGEIMKSNGMSDSDIEMMTSVLPVPLNPNMDIASQEFMDQVQKLGDAVERQMKHEMSKLTLDVAREMVPILKEDSEITAEDFQMITHEYFPAHIQDALRQEGVLP